MRSVCPSFCESVTLSGSCDNFKSSSYFFLKHGYMAIWTLCTSFHFVPTSKFLVAMATNIYNEKKSDNGGACRGHTLLSNSLVFLVSIVLKEGLFYYRKMKSTCHPTSIATETMKRRPNKMTTPQIKIKST